MKFTTLLASIRHNELALTCKVCGHTGVVRVVEVIELFGPDKQVRDVLARARCKNCKAKGQLDAKITYRGGSDGALVQADMRDREKLP